MSKTGIIGVVGGLFAVIFMAASMETTGSVRMSFMIVSVFWACVPTICMIVWIGGKPRTVRCILEFDRNGEYFLQLLSSDGVERLKRVWVNLQLYNLEVHAMRIAAGEGNPDSEGIVSQVSCLVDTRWWRLDFSTIRRDSGTECV